MTRNYSITCSICGCLMDGFSHDCKPLEIDDKPGEITNIGAGYDIIGSGEIITISDNKETSW